MDEKVFKTLVEGCVEQDEFEREIVPALQALSCGNCEDFMLAPRITDAVNTVLRHLVGENGYCLTIDYLNGERKFTFLNKEGENVVEDCTSVDQLIHLIKKYYLTKD